MISWSLLNFFKSEITFHHELPIIHYNAVERLSDYDYAFFHYNGKFIDPELSFCRVAMARGPIASLGRMRSANDHDVGPWLRQGNRNSFYSIHEMIYAAFPVSHVFMWHVSGESILYPFLTVSRKLNMNALKPDVLS